MSAIPQAVTPLRETVAVMVKGTGSLGITAAEMRKTLRRHHGHVSAALSVLHRDGVISRLSERRNGYKVYVSPEDAHGRPTEPQGRGSGSVH